MTSPFKPLKLLHISDLHFGPVLVPKVAQALLRDANKLAPDVIVASGDFTQRATQSQFAEARDFLAALPPVPQVVVPGNHDVPLYRVWERLLSPYKLYQQYIREQLDDVWQVPGATIVGLNSSRAYTAISNGRISREQLLFCREAFAQTPPQDARIVVAHHHFAPAPDYEGSQTVPKSRRALDIFVQLKIDLILGGHLHRAYVGNSLDVYAGKDREHGIVIAQCGTSTSRRGRGREREKNSFNLVRIGERDIFVTHFMYFDDADEFAPIARHQFPRMFARTLEME
jgi:3',5'-cyclic AMP phosphodiesterase CpdA